MLLFEEVDYGCVGGFLLLVGQRYLFGLLEFLGLLGLFLLFGLDLVNKFFDNVVLGLS